MFDARLAPFAPMALATLLTAACVEPVVLGGEGGSGGDASQDSTGVTSTSGNTVAAASTGTGSADVAALTALWNSPQIEAGLCIGLPFNPSPCVLPEVPDDALVLVFDSRRPICELPVNEDFSQGPYAWRVHVALPPEKQAVGIYLLEENPDIFVAQATEHENGGVGSGVATNGAAIEIVAIDGTNVTARINGMSDGATATSDDGIVTTWNSDGEYVSVPCE